MKIENDFQADAAQKWIERINKHISNLNSVIAPAIATKDLKIVAHRLKESLQASLITYSEEKNYGSAPQQSKEETEGRVREPCEAGVTDPEGDNPASKGTEHQGKKTEVDHDLSSESFQSRR